MEQQQLQQWTELISRTHFHRPFAHQIRFNTRLRACGGRYFPKTGDIDISWHHWKAFGETEVELIIKHELCHYHLHQQQLPFGHRDASFKTLLAEVGGARYCRTLPSSQNKRKRLRPVAHAFRYQVICNGCARVALRQRRLRVEKYRCGKCHGSLRLIDVYEVMTQKVHD